MSRRSVRSGPALSARRCAPGLLVGLLLMAAPLWAQTELPITIGAGLQTSFVHSSPHTGKSTDQLLINSVRLYVNGPVNDKIKFMFNTEFDGATNKVGVLDAVARVEMSPQFNIWAGRFLPPSPTPTLRRQNPAGPTDPRRSAHGEPRVRRH